MGHAIGTEPAYYAALAGSSGQAKGVARQTLSVSIDIIGGTSAGGINGIALSKGSGDRRQPGTAEACLDRRGDIRALLRAPTLWLPATGLSPAACQLFRLASATTPLRGSSCPS